MGEKITQSTNFNYIIMRSFFSSDKIAISPKFAAKKHPKRGAFCSFYFKRPLCFILRYSVRRLTPSSAAVFSLPLTSQP